MVSSRLLLLTGLALAGAIRINEKAAPKAFDEGPGDEHTFDMKAPPKMQDESCPRMVEKLRNDGNGAAYMGSIHIGGNQMDHVIWDTGSDQQVVNSVRTVNMVQPCAFLPESHTRCFNAYASPTYEALDVNPKRISYGSGDTMVLAGAETIGLKGGKCLVEHMPFYELMATEIQQILTHDLDVVAGLAPNKFTGTQLLKHMNMDRFSFCFNKDTSKDGYLYWSDNEPADQSGFHFWSAPVSGAANYWSVKVEDMALEHKDGKTLIGCAAMSGGCTAIVDTGTSLLTLDDRTLNNLENFVESFAEEKLDCTAETLSKFPTLTTKINGNDFNLRPEDYIMYTEVDEDQFHQQFKDTKKFLQSRFPNLHNMFHQKMKTGKKQCVLMFTEPIADNVLILGMPTFRNYKVTFDRWHQRVNFAKHDGSCKPQHANFKESSVQRLQHIDVSKLRYSNAYHTLSKKTAQLRQQKEVQSLK